MRSSVPSPSTTVQRPDDSSYVGRGDLGAEADVAPKVEPVDHVVEVALGLGLLGEVLLPLPLVEELLREQVGVGVALGVEPRARVAVPVPRTADAAAGFDELRGETGFPRAVQLVDAGDAGADDEHVDVELGFGGTIDLLYRPVGCDTFPEPPGRTRKGELVMADRSRYRVVQWTTGNVGKSSVQAIVANPTLELVGCYAWSPEKVGRDVGELCGIAPLGLAATDDVDALLALKPDCVVYNPMWLDTDELVRILSAGVNVVATAAFITGHNLGPGRERIAEACRRGGSTMFGTGVSPGFAELLAIVSATICDRVDKITVNEAADTTFYDSPATEIPVGFGKPIDHPDLQAMTAQGTAVFGEAVRLIADALGVELDDVRCEAEYAQTTADLDLGSWTIPAGCVAGVAASWKGSVGDKVLVELNVRWRKGQTLDPDWKIDQDGWVIQIDGRPTVTLNVGFLPPPDFEAETIADFMVLGHIMTAAPPLNAIPAVVAAATGHRDVQRLGPGAAPRDRVAGVTTVDRKSSALPVPFAMDPEFPDRVPKERYYDPDFYQMEVEWLWPRVWQMACRLEEIPQPHDFVEYEILDQSVIVVRTDDMGVRAFQNACRHRGVKVVEGRGTCEQRFHLPVPRLVLRRRRHEHRRPAAQGVRRAQPAARRHRPRARALRDVGRLRVDQLRRRRPAGAASAWSRPRPSSTRGTWSRCGPRSGTRPAFR